MLQQSLMSLIGLNETDTRVYLDLLQYGISAASSVGTRTRIDRTTVYAALKRMMARGLIAHTTKKGTQHFSALEPLDLEISLKQDIEKHHERLRSLQKLIPELSLLKEHRSTRPAVQIFEGVDGVISLYELMLRTNPEQRAFLTIDTLPKELRPYLTKTYIQQKKRYHAHSRVIIQDSKDARKYQKLDRQANRETKIIPKIPFAFETEIILGKEEIAVIDLSTAFFGVLIKSSTISNTLRSIFEMLWATVPSKGRA